MRKGHRTLLALAAALAFGPAVPARAQLLAERFSYPNGLITNEFAYYNPTNSAAKKNGNWELTSGSLFASNGAGWTGVPDDKAVNAASSAGTNSAVFRMDTVRKDFGNVSVSFRLLNQGLRASPGTPAQAWDGVHVWLRYKTQYNLYYASINRRDNTSIIKKKVPGGPSNGGTYYNLSPSVRHAVPYNQWQNVRADVVTNADGSVTIRLYANGSLVVQAVDNGTVGGAPITGTGGVGLRGDNANLKFDDFVITALGGGTADASAPLISGVRVQNNTAYWTTNEPATSLVEWGLTTAYGSRYVGPSLKTSHAMAMAGVTPGRLYNYRVTSRNAAGLTTVSSNLTFTAVSTGDKTPPSISGVGATNVTASSGEVVWTTNEPADTQVEYGLTTAYGSRTALNTARTTGHRAAVSGLKPGTRYYYRVLSRDAAGNLKTGDGLVHAFTTKASGDTAAPSISGVGSTNVKTSSAEIVWRTSEPADTQVEYGLTTAYGSRTALNASKTTGHRAFLSGLRPGTRYYYRVRSRDAAGNLKVGDGVIHALTTKTSTGV